MMVSIPIPMPNIKPLRVSFAGCVYTIRFPILALFPTRKLPCLSVANPIHEDSIFNVFVLKSQILPLTQKEKITTDDV